MEKDNITSFNTRGVRLGGKYYINPLFEVVQKAFKQKVRYNNYYDLIPATYDDDEFMDLVARCGLDVVTYKKKLHQWNMVIKKIDEIAKGFKSEQL